MRGDHHWGTPVFGVPFVNLYGIIAARFAVAGRIFWMLGRWDSRKQRGPNDRMYYLDVTARTGSGGALVSVSPMPAPIGGVAAVRESSIRVGRTGVRRPARN